MDAQPILVADLPSDLEGDRERRGIDLPRVLADKHLPAARRALYEASYPCTAHEVDALGAAREG